MEDRVKLKVGDLVKEKSIRALRQDSPYSLGIVLSVIDFDMDIQRSSAKIKWSDCTMSLWHPQRRLERLSD